MKIEYSFMWKRSSFKAVC